LIALLFSLIYLPPETVGLPGPASGIAAGPGSLFIIAQTGEEVWRYDLNEIEIFRLSLPYRILNPEDLVADQLFIYIHTSDKLFRFWPDRGMDSLPLREHQIADIDIADLGELYLADPRSQRIFRLDRLGRKTDFGPLLPGLEALLWSDERLWVLTNNEIIELDRIGRVRSRIGLPVRADLIGRDDAGGFYLARRYSSVVYYLSPTSQISKYELSYPIRDLAVVETWLFILEIKGKLLKIKLD
jgi:hypothetical protein